MLINGLIESSSGFREKMNPTLGENFTGVEEEVMISPLRPVPSYEQSSKILQKNHPLAFYARWTPNSQHPQPPLLWKVNSEE